MQRERPFLLLIFWFCALKLTAADYDLCKDILREGIRDTISTSNISDSKKASHYEFCSIAKKHNLTEQNFLSFASNYAQNLYTKNDQYGGSLNIGYGPFSLGGGYQQGNNNNRSDQRSIEDILKRNSKKILDYYYKNCGDLSYTDSLQAEATISSKIANAQIVKAWRDCMLNQSGFFVELVQGGSSNNDQEQMEYDILASWKSTEGTKIVSLTMRYQRDKVASPYPEVIENGGFISTSDICHSQGFTLINGSGIPLSIVHKDRKKMPL